MRRRHDAAAPDDGWTSEVSSALALAGFLSLVFVGFTLLAMGPLISLDAYFNLAPPPHGWLPALHVMDRIGQRAVALPVLTVATLACCRARRSWRPAWLVATSVFSLNLLMLILKVGLGRGQPEAANPSFFVGGMAYPSGHTGNIVLVYGLAVYLVGHYRRAGHVTRYLLWGLVTLLSVTMVVTSLTLNWHWFADLIAGLLVGGVVLELTIAADAALPEDALHAGPWQVARRVRRWLTGLRLPARARRTPVRDASPVLDAPVLDEEPVIEDVPVLDDAPDLGPGLPEPVPRAPSRRD
jgi:undecaprenyl-diphosphatase